MVVLAKRLGERPYERGVGNALGKQPRMGLEVDRSRRVGLAACRD